MAIATAQKKQWKPAKNGARKFAAMLLAGAAMMSAVPTFAQQDSTEACRNYTRTYKKLHTNGTKDRFDDYSKMVHARKELRDRGGNDTECLKKEKVRETIVASSKSTPAAKLIRGEYKDTWNDIFKVGLVLGIIYFVARMIKSDGESLIVGIVKLVKDWFTLRRRK